MELNGGDPSQIKTESFELMFVNESAAFGFGFGFWFVPIFLPHLATQQLPLQVPFFFLLTSSNSIAFSLNHKIDTCLITD